MAQAPRKNYAARQSEGGLPCFLGLYFQFSIKETPARGLMSSGRRGYVRNLCCCRR